MSESVLASAIGIFGDHTCRSRRAGVLPNIEIVAIIKST
jgi:hypothetical protein